MTAENLLDLLDAPPKPPYYVASMRKRLEIPRNGLRAVSTFSGCGGSSLGLTTAGFEIPYAVEFIPGAIETYRANFPYAYVDTRDIRDVRGEEILDYLGLAVGELDLFEGSPPCSSFSASGYKGGVLEDTVGKVKAYSEGVKQRTDDLFDEWLRLILEIRPRAILAENVPELATQGAPGRYLAGILSRLHEAGYGVYARTYSSLGVGAATRRTRLVILGVRRDVGEVPRPALLSTGYTIREALATLPVPIPDEELAHAWVDGTGRLPDGTPIQRYAIADEWEKTRLGESSERFFNLIRCDLDRPLPTATATLVNRGAAGIMHGEECRKFTPTEIAWLSGFPADFLFPGPPTARLERIGRAVTPPLYEALGRELARAIGGRV